MGRTPRTELGGPVPHHVVSRRGGSSQLTEKELPGRREKVRRGQDGRQGRKGTPLGREAGFGH